MTSRIVVNTSTGVVEIEELTEEEESERENALSEPPPPPPITPPTEILLALLQDVTDVDETKPIIEAMLLIIGGKS